MPATALGESPPARVPTFSIVMPMFNREREVVRALNSCLQQDCEDFEVIVVDDASTDASFEAARSLRDPRVRVLRHEVNHGHGKARNTAIDAAVGAWVIFLDSDDELIPGGLTRMYRETQAVDERVQRLAFMYQRDDGRVSPLPPFRHDVIDYRRYLEWLEGRELYDFVCCSRRHTFADVPQPIRRWSDQSLYHLEFAQRYVTRCFQDEVALVHTDAANRSSQLRRGRRDSVASALELGSEMDLLLTRHGDALREVVPTVYEMFRRMRGAYHFLSGHRIRGLAYMAGCVRATPLLPEAWMLMLLGLAPTSVFAAVRSRRGAST